MANAKAHQLASALVVGMGALIDEGKKGKATPAPIAAGALAAWCASLPDLIEPATSPNHRQFFHSVLFASGLAIGGYKLYKWDPDEPLQQFIRAVGLVAIGSYLVHLALDATTPRSLPVIGRL